MSAPQFAVIVDTGSTRAPSRVMFGPFADKADAEGFAEFATGEIDPAQVVTLMSPVDELLRWRKAEREWRDGRDQQ